MERELAQLRHAYSHLKAGRVTKQAVFADGLIAPVIESLERMQEAVRAKPVDINGLNRLRYALDDVIGYLADNSCGDPECCGGPYYEKEDFDRGTDILAEFGLKYTDKELPTPPETNDD